MAKEAGTLALGARYARRRLRIAMVLFFFILAVPLAVLLGLSFLKLLDEARLKQRFVAEQAADAIRSRIDNAIAQEEARPFDHYSFYTVAKVAFAQQQALQRSPLSELTPQSTLPGLIGYFQIAPDGTLSSPLIPDGWSPAAANDAFPASEASARLGTVRKVESVLTQASGDQVVRPSKRRDQPVVAGDLGTSAVSEEAPYSDRRLSIKGRSDAGSSYDYDQGRISQDILLNSQQGRLIAKDELNEKRDFAGAKMLGADKQELSKSLADGYAYESKAKVARKEFANSVQVQIPEELDVLKKSNEKMRESRQAPNSPAVSQAVASRITVAPKITSFEAEIDPFQVIHLTSGHIVLFRKTWQGEKRIIQGAVVDATAFFEAALQDESSNAALPPASTMEISFENRPLVRLQLPDFAASSFAESYVSRKASVKSAHLVVERENFTSMSGKMLFSAPLPDPLSHYNITFFSKSLVLPSGSTLIMVLGAFLLVTLFIGVILLYRLGSTQITLAQKRNDFVSAVSHELKTPLTSIRMYGEMLRNNWVTDETKKRSYYDYIFQESERLSRLIANVLRLSKLSNSNDAFELQEISPAKMLHILQEKVAQITTSSGFTLSATNDDSLASDSSRRQIRVDLDALSQIAINLVDNAVKFSKDAEQKVVEMGFRFEESSGRVILYVRDFGPGVPKAEQRKIFELFYRSESELTRKTTGTGIGLALVKELAARMGARINYRAREPGAEFQVVFPIS